MSFSFLNSDRTRDTRQICWTLLCFIIIPRQIPTFTLLPLAVCMLECRSIWMQGLQRCSCRWRCAHQPWSLGPAFACEQPRRVSHIRYNDHSPQRRGVAAGDVVPIEHERLASANIFITDILFCFSHNWLTNVAARCYISHHFSAAPIGCRWVWHAEMHFVLHCRFHLNLEVFASHLAFSVIAPE